MKIIQKLKHKLVINQELIFMMDMVRLVVGLTPLENYKWVPDFFKDNPGSQTERL